MIASLLFVAGVAAASPMADPAHAVDCDSQPANEVVVCGRQKQRYRIDRSVLQASRELEAAPPKPPVTAEAVPANGCVGGHGQGCNDGALPLVGMALAAAKAAVLAANGDDWRDAIRTHEDEYRLYKQAEKRRADERKPKIGLKVGK